MAVGKGTTPVREAAPGRRQLGPGRLELAITQLKWAILNPSSNASQANTPSAFICLTQRGGGEYREARMNLEMFAPPARGCVRARCQPASANWTSSLALNLASWKSFFKYILFNLLKSRPACGKGGATRLCEARAHLGRRQTSWTAAARFWLPTPKKLSSASGGGGWAGIQGHCPQAAGTC